MSTPRVLYFIGFTFQDDRDLYASNKIYLNVAPSKKSLQQARDALGKNRIISAVRSDKGSVVEQMRKVITDC
ncbi:MAG: hypothetical protein NTV46_07175 [Verrucomicrobia bacterium]|nr:hypothetical protein [Verrucomicrobiota bacterium]